MGLHEFYMRLSYTNYILVLFINDVIAVLVWFSIDDARYRSLSLCLSNTF